MAAPAKTGEIVSSDNLQDARQAGVHGMYTHQQRLKVLHEAGHSWRRIQADYPEYKAISLPSLARLARGIDPGNKVRHLLGLPPAATVIVIGGGQIPEGAQVISADQCECGQWFISNHPRRHKCFVCSPARRKARK